MPQEDDESEIKLLKKELEVSRARIEPLEKEKQELKQEVSRLKAQISSLRAHNNERKTMLWKKLQNSLDSNYTDASQHKPSIFMSVSEQRPGVPEKTSAGTDIPEAIAEKKTIKVPNPPPRPHSVTPSLPKEVVKGNTAPPTPPPPPLPSKLLAGSRAVRRVPEVMELYRSLTRRDANKDNRTNPAGTPVVAFTKNMIGEIENRSSYLSAIKSDVESREEFIKFLVKEVESAAHRDISEVESFVKWLDEELSSLVDERAVLRHFPQWPERKADALREAAFTYRDLRSLESEVSHFEDNPKEPLAQALRRIQALQDRLEQSIDNIERMRESTSKRYRDLLIPWEWMLDTGLIGQMKLSSLKLAKEYMKRIAKELQSDECSNDDNLMLQGVRFAYRVHQFAGGFDAETIQVFQKLKKVGLGSDK
ncbi:protein CHUP1, chloroplastic isoform X1 [Quercus lobata]|uniref:Protein CHUP1, chloroplastic n=1 Tax=Quercus lobata TaxID=97700 RepID=A0A7N2KQ18_QUELO|nr:protein CHUP1, chloroplastic isoform X1 [Quercus lobata]